MARKAGLEPNGFFMVGLTGDTEATMQDTIDYARKVRLETMKCGITVPFPGTPAFNRLRREGRIKTFDWDNYTVYNQAETLYDHPTLSWDTINRYFKKFYCEAYLKNPAYIWRRLVFMLKNHEIFWNVYYTLKFFFMLWGRPPAPEKEAYAYEDRWRPLDIKPNERLRVLEPPKARRAASRKRARPGGIPAA